MACSEIDHSDAMVLAAREEYMAHIRARIYHICLPERPSSGKQEAA